MRGSAPFADRRDAGRQLAAALPALDPGSTVVVALPRGGVPVAEEICASLGLPLDLVFVRKIGLPGQPELAVGAIADGTDPTVIINHQIARSAGLSNVDVETMGHALLPEIERRKSVYFDGIEHSDLRGKTVVVVDDGVATGATLRTSLQALRKAGVVHIILALPTAPPDVLATLRPLAEETLCLHQPTPFWSVGAAYRNFSQTSDDEVIQALRHCAGITNRTGDA